MKTTRLFFRRFLLVILTVTTSYLIFAVGINDQLFEPPEQDARNRLFDAQWQFFRGENPGAENPSFDDSKWRKLNLPHDWSIEDVPANEDRDAIGPFSKKSPGTFNTGNFMGGTGWYRKHFRLEKEDAGKLVSVLFDGVFMNSEVWINGHYLGIRPNGYVPFYYDLTAFLKPAGEENVLTVKATNKGDNSRWYTGSGIYRHVYLNVTNSVHVAQWGVTITTPKVSETQATIDLAITIENMEAISETVILKTKIFSPEGKQVAETSGNGSVSAKLALNLTQNLVVKSPSLWSDKTPKLYVAQTEVWKGSKLIDQVNKKFGIRSLEFSPEKGFLLNGKPTKLRGGCIHHDNGILGSVTYDRAEARRIEVLKANGYNAIRTSHNPPSKSLLDACDRLGMFVIDEAFDVWREQKVPDDFHSFFQQWWKHDLTAMMMRDRNHPSVIIWSVGNEIPEKDYKYFYAMADSLVKKVKELDQTRPVLQAICCFDAYKKEETQSIFLLDDLVGANYEWKSYEGYRKDLPKGIFVGTETFPKEALENEQIAQKYPWVIGDFVWTAMDYYGESEIGLNRIYKNGEKTNDEFKPGNWPWTNAWCGDIDACGFKKPQSYYRDVVWGKSKLEMMVNQYLSPDSFAFVGRWGWPKELPNWTRPGSEGKLLKVNVYTTYQQIRLELNGKEIATKTKTEADKITLSFEVPYTSGKLKAIALENGKEVASKELITAGKPMQLRLTADRSSISANINDLSYITVELVDKDGNVVPLSGKSIRFSVKGAGSLAAAGNSNPTELQSFQDNKSNLFVGKCLVVVRSNGMKGSIRVKAEADGMEGASLTINVNN